MFIVCEMAANYWRRGIWIDDGDLHQVSAALDQVYHGFGLAVVY